MTYLIDQLPLIEGVCASKVYLPAKKTLKTPYQTVFEYLRDKFSHIEPSVWYKRFDNGQIYGKKSLRYVPIGINDSYDEYQNTTVYYYKEVENEPIVPFDYQILFENERFLAVDKPHFLTISPAGRYVKQTLLSRLKQDTKNSQLSPIHRLDKDTAGVVLFSKQAGYRKHYQGLFLDNHQSRKIKKIYHAIAPINENIDFPTIIELNLERGDPFYTMAVKDGKPNTKTHIRIIETNHTTGMAKYELMPETGKLHQLRVHLAYLNIPIKNDPFYPILNHKKCDDFTSPLQLLAKSLSFVDPIDGNEYCFQSLKNLEL